MKSEVEGLKISPLAGKIQFNLYICIPKKQNLPLVFVCNRPEFSGFGIVDLMKAFWRNMAKATVRLRRQNQSRNSGKADN